MCVCLQLEEDLLNFDICLTTPSMLDRFKPLQRKLKSKMPNIRRGTVYLITAYSVDCEQVITVIVASLFHLGLGNYTSKCAIFVQYRNTMSFISKQDKQ